MRALRRINALVHGAGHFMTVLEECLFFCYTTLSAQGDGMRRTGRTPIDVNAANLQKMALGACIPLSTEGILRGNILCWKGRMKG